ncbi:MAG: metallophosphoesterase [Bacteroidia bacterium]|nr:metallophosphoesterase [Bacteroidia bacterium]
MLTSPLSGLILIALLVVLDYYVYQAVVAASLKFPRLLSKFIRRGHWFVTAVSLAALSWYYFGDPDHTSLAARQWVVVWVMVNYVSKIFALVFIFADDVIRGFKYLGKARKKQQPFEPDKPGTKITRSEFLARTAIIAGAVPFTAMAYGIISGAHDYRVRRRTVYLPNLPKAFDGLRIGQISDIHSGTFFNKIGVQGGVDMLLQEKPDIVFFTGDLVNYQTREVDPYVEIFSRLKAPMGVFSVTGNHDYGDYRSWTSLAAKRQNFQDLIAAHKTMNYDLLMNEHRLLRIDNESIAIIGIENWGTGRFPKYGRLDVAHRGTEDVPVKLLLSHDPSHWDAEVRPKYPDIDLMFAGHTHGFQMGIEIGDFRWSPSQYMYKQWADLYQQGDQFLYVNRGYGCIGYPGRIGMPPEITIIELKRRV